MEKASEDRIYETSSVEGACTKLKKGCRIKRDLFCLDRNFWFIAIQTCGRSKGGMGPQLADYVGCSGDERTGIFGETSKAVLAASSSVSKPREPHETC